jgi:Caspase domain
MLHAVLIGINTYKNAAIPSLNACLNDVAEMQTLLSGYKSLKPCFYVYKNEAATRAAIIDILKQINTKIQPEDSFLFYFSGHGAEEYSDIVAFGDKIEGFVCYDSLSANDLPLLANKEFRYLLAPIADKVQHALAITDCCHSGEITRGLLARKIEAIQAKRDWQNFVFADKIALRTAMELPIGKHIHIAACAKNCLAFEKNGAGVLTQKLIKAVREARGTISYQLLKSRLLFAIDTTNQRPNIEAYKTDINANFLTNQALQSHNETTLQYNESRKTWLLATGAKLNLLNVNLLKTTRFVVYKNEEVQPVLLKIMAVEQDVTTVENNPNLDPKIIYTVVISGGYKPLFVTLAKDIAPDLLTVINNGFLKYKKTDTCAIMLQQTSDSEFELCATGSRISPKLELFDKKNPQVALNQVTFDIENIWKYCILIQKWRRVFEFQNTNTQWSLQNLPIKITVLANNQAILPNSDNIYTIKENTTIGIELTNTDGRQLYLGAACLSAQFGMQKIALTNTTLYIAGQKSLLFGASPQILSIPEHKKRAGITSETYIYKLIFGTEAIDISTWQQPEIPPPIVQKSNMRDHNSCDYDLSLFDDPPTPDWATLNLRFCVSV